MRESIHSVKARGMSHGNCYRAIANSSSHPIPATRCQCEALVLSRDGGSDTEAFILLLEERIRCKGRSQWIQALDLLRNKEPAVANTFVILQQW